MSMESPDAWMFLEKETIWESDNGKWRVEREGNIEKPSYKVIGNGEEYPFSYDALHKLGDTPVPKYVKKAIEEDPTRESIQTVKTIHTKYFGTVLVRRWETYPNKFGYHVYTNLLIDDIPHGSVYGKPFYSLEEASHPDIEDMGTFCNRLIKEAFPEADVS